jgi:PiT family inorganic phosphate transporter
LFARPAAGGGGFCAETSGALTLFATNLARRFSVSTTHTITGAIVGVGAARGISALRWNVASDVVTAWVRTLPAATLIYALAMRP